MNALEEETIEPVTWRHLRLWGGVSAYTDEELAAVPLVGWMIRNERGRPMAIGAVGWWSIGPIGMFDARPVYRAAMTAGRSLRIHRLARQVLAAVLAVEPRVFAYVDEAVPRSAAWARRLGFRPVDREEGIWACELVPGGSQGRQDRGHGAFGRRHDQGGE